MEISTYKKTTVRDNETPNTEVVAQAFLMINDDIGFNDNTDKFIMLSERAGETKEEWQKELNTPRIVIKDIDTVYVFDSFEDLIKAIKE